MHVENRLVKAKDPQVELEALLASKDEGEAVSANDAVLLLRMKLNTVVGKAPLDGMRGDIGNEPNSQ